MAIVKPFQCVRPDERYASQVAALPYDVYSRKEACQVTAANPRSFLNIDRPETQFSDDVDIYDDRVYEKAREMLKSWIEDGTLKKKIVWKPIISMNLRWTEGVRRESWLVLPLMIM